MKRNILFIGILLFITASASLFSACTSCSERKAQDITSLPGIYTGEATIVLPDHVKAMMKTNPEGNKLVPEGPIPCKIEIKSDENKQLSLQLIGFQMPVSGIVVSPAKSEVTQTDTTFNLKGGGDVTYGQMKMSYTHEGKIKQDDLDLDITVSIIPMVVEPRIVFKGKRQ